MVLVPVSASAAQSVVSFNLWDTQSMTMFYVDYAGDTLNNTQTDVETIRFDGYTFFQNYSPYLAHAEQIKGVRAISSSGANFTVGSAAGYVGRFNISLLLDFNSGYFTDFKFYDTAYVRFYTSSNFSTYITASCYDLDADDFTSSTGSHTGTFYFELDLTNVSSSTIFYGFMIYIPISATPFEMVGAEYGSQFTSKFYCYDCIISDDLTAAQMSQMLKDTADRVILENDRNTADIMDNQNANTEQIIQNQDENTQDIIDNQDENADKIVGAIEQSQENEKQESNDSGNDAVNSVSGAIPADNEGFISAIKTLSNSMSYEGTDAVWTIPSMKIPAMDGVCSEIVLTKDLQVNFGDFIGMLPSNILKVVQIICTIALVIFSVKELYGTIQEVMVNRRSSEG